MRRIPSGLFRDRQGNLDPITLVAFGVGALAAFSIVAIVLGEWVAMLLRQDHRFDVQALGVAVGAVLVGFGPALTGYAAYWASDAYNMRVHEEVNP